MLTADETSEAGNALTRLTDWQNAVTDRLFANKKRPSKEIQNVFDNLSILRNLLRPRLEHNREELIELQRPK